jgi:hypothetical protein
MITIEVTARPVNAPRFEFKSNIPVVTRWEIPEGTDLHRFKLIKGMGLSTSLFDRLYRGDWVITLPLFDGSEGFLLEDYYLPGMGGKFDTLEAAIQWADTVDARDCQHLIEPDGPMPVMTEF